MNDMLIKAVSGISKDNLSIIFYNLYNLKYKFLRKKWQNGVQITQ